MSYVPTSADLTLRLKFSFGAAFVSRTPVPPPFSSMKSTEQDWMVRASQSKLGFVFAIRIGAASTVACSLTLIGALPFK
jgi:hypothetical protein